MISCAAWTLVAAAFSLQTSAAPAAPAAETRLADGLARARTEGKPVFVDFWRDQCPWCIRLETNTLPEERVVAALAGFVVVRAKNDDHADAIARYGVSGYPTLALLDAEGRAVDLHAGYLGPEEFLGWLTMARGLHDRIKAYRERIAKDGKDAEALLGLGKLLAGNGKWDDARECFDHILKADPEGKRPESIEALLETGIIWRKTREYRKSAEAIGRARELLLASREKAPPAGSGASGKDPEKEAGKAPRARGLDPLDRLLHELAATCLVLGDRKTLVAALEEYDGKVDHPDERRHAWVLLQLGQARRKTGAPEESAAEAFRKCDRLYPRSPEAREARAELRPKD